MQSDLDTIMPAAVPGIDADALARAEAAEKGAAPATPRTPPGAAELRDAAGELFDPARHLADASGKPILNYGKDKPGTFRARPGRRAGKAAPRARGKAVRPGQKAEIAPAAPAAPADQPAPPPAVSVLPDPTDAPAPAEGIGRPLSDVEVLAEKATALSLMPKMVYFGRPVTELQREAVRAAWLNWANAYGLKTPPPWLDLALALGLVYSEEVGDFMQDKEKQARALLLVKKIGRAITWPIRALTGRAGPPAPAAA